MAGTGRWVAVGKNMHARQNSRGLEAVLSATAASQRWLATAASPLSIARLLPGDSSGSPPVFLCPQCQSRLGSGNETYRRFAVCDYCGYHLVWSANARIEQLADRETFRTI